MTSGERAQIRKALRAVQAAGFRPTSVDDGGDELVYGGDPYMTETEVLGAVGAVDDARVHFRNENNRRAWFYVVLGNAKDGSEVIADNSVTPGFAEALDAIMEGTHPHALPGHWDALTNASFPSSTFESTHHHGTPSQTHHQDRRL